MAKSKFTGESILWVPNGADQASLDAKIAALRAQGNRVIIFRSGKGDLSELTGELLRRNRDSGR